MHCETVKIVSPISEQNPLGYIVINKTDLLEEHELFEEARAAASEKKDGDTAPKTKARAAASEK